MKGKWGCSDRSKKVHYFVDSKSLCGRSTNMHNAETPETPWDVSDPITCETCKEMKTLFEKGLRPVFNS